jgi:glycine/D-amino acid oxidase-like deaminating enzyme
VIPVRIVVVGGGVVGLLTAMECGRLGAEVDLVDQADLPSRLATSYDRHRVVRALHRGDAGLTRAAARAQQGWLEVERRVGARFYHRVGALTAMPPEEVPPNLALLTAAGAAGRAVSPVELATRYPRIRFPAGLAAVVEPVAGAVLADRALAVLTGWLGGQAGVRLFPRRRVVDIDDAGFLRLADGHVLAADRIVVAAGPWSRDLLPAELSRDLTLYRQSMLSYAPTPSRRAWAGVPAIPALGTAQGAWLMPPVAGTPVRLSAASACRAVTELADRVTPAHWRSQLVDHFRDLLADFDPAAVVGANDGYYLADTATGGPVLATFGDGTVWAYAACGGMSFKFAPLVAGAVADRALGRRPRRTGLDPVDRPRELAPGRRPGGYPTAATPRPGPTLPTGLARSESR